jgi:lipoate-protein ligase A
MSPRLARPDPEAALRERLGAAPWRLIHDGAAPGAWNMAVDSALLEAAAAGSAPPTLRFYAWAPAAVSLGRFQNADGIRLEEARRHGWDVVRRPTGGRAVLHHRELTYSLVLPPSVVGGCGVRTTYAVLADALHAGLAALLGGAATPQAGASCAGRAVRQPNCFAVASECDTLARGGKLVGSAQARSGGALLQHGSILLDADRDAWAALFGEAGALVTLGELLGRVPEAGEVARAVARGFESAGVRFQPGALSPVERDAAAGRSATFCL